MGVGYGNLCPLDNLCHVADTQSTLKDSQTNIEAIKSYA